MLATAPQAPLTRESAAQVVALTPAPCFDRIYAVGSLAAGEHHRAKASAPMLAGKGVNLARTLVAAGGRAHAVLPLSEADRAQVAVQDGQLELTTVDVPWSARQNVIITDESGGTTNLNSYPHPLSREEWTRLGSESLRAAVALGADWLVIAGTFPDLIGTDRAIDIAPLVFAARGHGLQVALDSSGRGLRSVLDPTVQVDLVKPNCAELADLVGSPIRTMGDAIDAADAVRAAGVSAVLASLGPDGVLLVGEETLWAAAPEVPVVNTTGAGDALLAGFLAERMTRPSGGLGRDLRRGVGWATAVVQQAAAALEGVPHASPVAVRRPDRSLVLR